MHQRPTWTIFFKNAAHTHHVDLSLEWPFFVVQKRIHAIPGDFATAWDVAGLDRALLAAKTGATTTAVVSRTRKRRKEPPPQSV